MTPSLTRLTRWWRGFCHTCHHTPRLVLATAAGLCLLAALSQLAGVSALIVQALSLTGLLWLAAGWGWATAEAQDCADDTDPDDADPGFGLAA